LTRPRITYSGSSSRYDGNKIKFDWQNNISLPLNIITAGFEFEEEQTTSEYHEFGMFPWSSIFPNASNSIYGLYIQDQFNYSNAFVTIGTRYDRNKTYGSKVTYRIAPAYLLTSGTKLKATYGTGFKSPSLFYLFDPVFGNKDLLPEESTGWDAGIEQYFFGTPLVAGFNYFMMQFDQMFGYDPATFRTININKASSEGVEIYIYSELFNKLRIKTNYTYTHVKDKSEGTGSSVELRKPKHKAAFIADYNLTDNALAGLEILYTGKRDDIYFSGDFQTIKVIMTDYILFNLNISSRVSNMVTLYTRFENLLNTRYEEIYGFGTPGFSVFAGVKINTINFFQ
jgi:vitamin B12 transporter